nr:hypothetical protein [Tanacetum cinerariifolium]
MTDNRTMAEMLRAPTEGCAEAIVVPPILAEQFELKHWAAHRWLEKEPPCSITTWDDLKFDESFHEAWERYKDLLRAYPHHGFTELHQLDTFYNALNPADQDSLNADAGGNLLEKIPQDALTIIENKSKPRLRLLRKSVLPVEVLICTTSVLPLVATLSQSTEITFKMNTASTSWSGTLPGNTIANPKGKLKAITTRNGLVTEGPTIPNPPKSVNPEEDECVKET